MKDWKKGQKEKIDFKNNLKSYFKLAWPYKFAFLFVIVIVLIKSLSGIAEKYLFKVLIDNGNEFVSGSLEASKFTNIILIVGIVFFGIVLVKSVSDWLRAHIINRLDVNMVRDLKRKFFNHLITLSHRFHASHKTGSLISRLSRGASSVENLNDFIIFNGAPLVLGILVVGLSIFYFDKLSALVVLIIIIVFVTYSLFIMSYERIYRKEMDDAIDKESGFVSDVFTNIESVKYFGKENRIKDIFAVVSDNTRRKYLKSWDYYKWLDSGHVLILGIGLIFLLYFPLVKFLSGGISIGTLTFIYTAYFELTLPLFGFVWGVKRFYESMVDMHALFSYEKINNDIIDKPFARKMEINKGEIEFERVSFNYNVRKIINNVSLKVKPGEKIALVGHSGSGKTTLVKLLYRLYDVNLGSIKIDGIDIKDVEQESLRGEMSIVPQEAILFDDTIYNNILFSNPTASREQVMKAIRFAQLDKFIQKLPKGEKTIVGQRGIKLSGGEKQRVSIARAILADKKILLLDEATSSLDSYTEHEIQKDLWELMKGRTSIIIAHRLSTIMHADRIVVMDKGRIVQVGNHRELIRQRGVYKELWGLQKGGYIGE